MAKKMTYKQSGVDIEQTNTMVKKIKTMCNSTNRKEVLGKIGNFSGFFSLPKGMKEPVLVGATDGVGTKLMIAQMRKEFTTIGIDLVAMCVNDLITSGAEPLFFLDYYATGKVKQKHFFDVLKGIVTGCKQSNSALIGGEIAEMPDCYTDDKYDLAGFSVGVVDKKKIIDGSRVKKKDVVLGIASSGLHSNGYSLARKLFTKKELAEGVWGKALLRPTTIYVKPIQALLAKVTVKAIAHITGGGLYDNVPRVIPKQYSVVIDKTSWKVPKLFKEMQKRGNIDDFEMYRTFNMGIGMAVVMSEKEVSIAQNILKKFKLNSWVIGDVTTGDKEVVIN